MTKPSNRYTRHIAVALLLTLIPVSLHSYINLKAQDRVSFEALSGRCHGKTDSETVGRRLRAQFGDVQWHAGVLADRDDSPSLDCWILRSYDPKKLYHLPEIGLLHGAAASRRAVDEVPWKDGTVPIHRVYYPDNDGDIYAAYLLIYNSQPVANPYLAQILSFPRQLLTGSAPMNLLFVSGKGPRGTLAVMEKKGNRWLVESLSYYRSLCGN